MALAPSISPISGKKSNLHPYHIVDPSPWPRVVAFTAFFLVLGLALYRHAYLIGYTLFSFGLVATILNSAFWWRDVVREATFEGHHTLSVQNGLRFGRILFIVSEVRLFLAFFWAFFHASLSPSPQIGAVWPPKGIEVISPWLIPLLNTGLLLTSGASLTWSHAALLGGYRREARAGLVLTVLLASVFTLLQAYEYVNAPFSIADGIYGSTFYRLTGLHGRHVLVGTIFLAVSLYRRARHHYTLSTHLGFECAAWYWHFVDVVWIFLFLAVYTWGEGVLHLFTNLAYWPVEKPHGAYSIRTTTTITPNSRKCTYCTLRERRASSKRNLSTPWASAFSSSRRPNNRTRKCTSFISKGNLHSSRSTSGKRSSRPSTAFPKWIASRTTPTRRTSCTRTTKPLKRTYSKTTTQLVSRLELFAQVV